MQADTHVNTDRDAADRYFRAKFSAPFFSPEPWFNFDPSHPRVICIDCANLPNNKAINARVNELVLRMQSKDIPPTIELQIHASCGHRQPFTLGCADMRLGNKRYKRMNVAASQVCSTCKAAAPQKSAADL